MVTACWFLFFAGILHNINNGSSNNNNNNNRIYSNLLIWRWAAAHKNSLGLIDPFIIRVAVTTCFLSIYPSIYLLLLFFWRGAGVLLMVPLMDPWMPDLTGIWGLWVLWQSLGVFAVSLSSSSIARGHPTGSAGAMRGRAWSAVFRWASEWHPPPHPRPTLRKSAIAVRGPDRRRSSRFWRWITGGNLSASMIVYKMKRNLPKNGWQPVPLPYASAPKRNVPVYVQKRNSGMKRTCSWDHVSDRWCCDKLKNKQKASPPTQ